MYGNNNLKSNKLYFQYLSSSKHRLRMKYFFILMYAGKNNCKTKNSKGKPQKKLFSQGRHMWFFVVVGPLSHYCREGKTLVVRPLKKHFFLCVSSLNGSAIKKKDFSLGFFFKLLKKFRLPLSHNADNKSRHCAYIIYRVKTWFNKKKCYLT